MTDSTWARVWHRRSDLPAFKTAGVTSVRPEGVGDRGREFVQVELNEVSPNDLNTIPEGVPYIFFRGHSTQGSYGAMEAVCDGKQRSRALMSEFGAYYAVRGVSSAEIEALRSHLAFKELVAKQIGVGLAQIHVATVGEPEADPEVPSL